MISLSLSIRPRFRCRAVTAAVVVGTVLAFLSFGAEAADNAVPPGDTSPSTTSVRTENYPRPPYSGATYYLYERSGRTICTKLAVCNKYDQCDTKYFAGAFKDSEDVETGVPYGTTPAVMIPRSSLARHVCLTRYGLANAR